MDLRYRALCGMALFAAFIVGCGSTEPTVVTTPMGAMGGGQPSGNKVFDAHCAKCHATKADGAAGSGPNLSKVGGTRTPEWLAEHVKNPKTHKPESKMPEFESKLSAEDLKTLTDFMAGLK